MKPQKDMDKLQLTPKWKKRDCFHSPQFDDKFENEQPLLDCIY